MFNFTKIITNTTPVAPVIEILSKTEAEWKAEMLLRCNVTLEIRKKVTNELIDTKIGLGPFTIKLQSIDDFTLGFKTQIK